MIQTEIHAEAFQIDEKAWRQSECERLQREHDELKARLRELDGRLYLSPAEEMERKTLQKLKLAKKARIAILTVRYTGNS